ncbi:MAG: enoyl-CoA hydratase/isomerase family protein [Cellvibrionaceae bacterium]|nr:enoyl-CoA hydratase/isomerase family protein [Cellvibrionaceae bacterium]
MTEQTVKTNTDSRGVRTISLGRPDIHNAFDDSVIAELSQAFAAADKDDSVRIVVLAAEGKSFSAGANLGWMKRMASYSYEENLNDANALAEMLRRLNFLSKPTIARVQGAAFGGAVGLVACCDLAVASPRASFCLSEVKIGLIPATISPYVIGAMGQRAARRYFLTAERFQADVATSLGLVSEVVEEDQLDNKIDELIEALLGNSPRAVAEAKKLVADIAGREIDSDLIADTSARIAGIRVSEQGQEGLSAFLEKRSPNWIQ